ncbi:MAG: hypothetical protein AAB470_01215 [Patescibacteria group bacterium]
MKYGNRSIWKKVISSPITTVTVLILIFFLAKATWNIYQKASLSGAKLSQAQAELLKLQNRQSDLSRKVDHLSTDQGIEAEIRTKYPAVKAGESVAVIIDDSQTANVSNATSTPELSWWKKMLRIFGL